VIESQALGRGPNSPLVVTELQRAAARSDDRHEVALPHLVVGKVVSAFRTDTTDWASRPTSSTTNAIVRRTSSRSRARGAFLRIGLDERSVETAVVPVVSIGT
jgi:hypothetical protein